MILAIAIAFCLMFPTGVWVNQAGPLFWATLWLSNFYFAFTHSGYFGFEARDSAVLHTWSLGVEEQFYLLWPLLLLLGWRWFRGDQRKIIAATAVFAMLGFVGCWVATAHLPIQAYYLMPTRLWELVLGALGFFFSSGIPRLALLTCESQRVWAAQAFC